MFDHVTIRVSDRDASVAVYAEMLGILGADTPPEGHHGLSDWGDFSIYPADADHPPTTGLHVGFVAPSREAVDAFHAAGLRAGWTDDGAPGPRTEYMPSYYGGFLRDGGGNSVEAVHHDDVRRGGLIDHLWIGVADLGRTETFYGALARHAGYRPGERWEQGRQYRGAWATASFLADGRPPTRGLHIAFPAPDRQVVGEFHAAALRAGGTDNGGPGERPEYHPGYYGAFVLDPDATNVESVVHERP